MRILKIALLGVFLGGTCHAQDDVGRTLGDMKLEIEFLSSQLDGLRKELLESGAALSTTNSGPALTRLDAIEHELRVLTGQMEELEHRVSTTTNEMENKLGDLEFRITELEGGTITAPEGRDDVESDIPVGVELTIAEREDFEAAKAALDKADYATAASGFGAFTTNYPGGPLTAVAHLYRGQALFEQEDWKNAGVSFLDSFSAAPKGPRAAEALFSLAESLAKLDKTTQACSSLAEIPVRFPESDFVSKVAAKQTELNCG